MKKGVFLLLFISIFLFNGFSIACANELTDDYLDIAKNYINNNNYTKALDYLNEVIKIEPENSEAIGLKNKICPTEKKVETQIEAESTAKVLTEVAAPPANLTILNIPQADVEKMSYNSDYYNQKGQELYKSGDFNNAITFFYKALQLNKKNAQAYNNLGMTYWRKNSPDLAIKFLKKANSISNNYTQPLVNLAMLYKQTNQFEKELKTLKKAIKLNSSDFEAYTLLGEYYRNKSDYKNAIAAYRTAIEINPKAKNAYFGLGFVYFESEDFNYSIEAFSKYIELEPDSDYAFYMVSKCFLVLQKYDFAKAAIQKAIKINNSNDYLFQLVQIDYYLGNYEETLKELETLMISSNSSEYFNYAGLCNYKLKNIDAAIANFNRAIELDSLRPVYYYNLAQCYKTLCDKKNYAKYVNTATRINPIKYQDFIDLSYVYFDNGNPAFAINTLNDAIAKYPTIKALYLSKLKIYEAIGDNLNYNETSNIIEERFNSNDSKKKIHKKK
jgi:tetratricopeptide (TPR) repeat protein